ncbi:unnamed protein product [Darwinula stevensoni]|uniref:Chitin-binding type-2 domain-containing protein n=1 Tax=Darwinula stevensoni TaxID=69355 RepID=A0A7R8XIW8_9CRUS|nr:unnamed protein product [Darwinula stevensoni]CAG0891659.1 unnamed protein product [Darwinula stevensoni]
MRPHFEDDPDLPPLQGGRWVLTSTPTATPRSSFRSVQGRLQVDFEDMGESGGRLARIKEFCFKRSILIFITLASFGGAAFLVGLGLNAQTVFPGSDPNALESPSVDSRPLSASESLVASGNRFREPERVYELRELTSCPEHEGLQLYPHPKYCDQFYKCANGTLSLETCENGLLFDGKGSVYNYCNYHWAVECGQARIADIPAIRSPGCEFRFGIFPKSSHCETTYIKCEFGIPDEKSCIAGLAYDDRVHQCNWPDLTPDCDPEEIVNFKCPDKLPPGSLARKFLPFPRFSAGDCQSLIVCVNGYPRRVQCEVGKVFNRITLSCDYPENVPEW